MAVEVYIPTQATFEAGPLDGARVLTLYDADSDTSHGSMTLSRPLEPDTQGGPLEVLGHRDGKLWRVSIAALRVRRSTAVGIEFDIAGRLTRVEAVSDQS